MNQQPGFSLIEVLISLMLVTSISLCFLQRHWDNSKFFNQLIKQLTFHSQWMNQSESHFKVHVL
jgi:prepilin-type N-terminal cleavage/methylation domain-containing protein